MRRSLAIVIVLAACASKKEPPPPVDEPEPEPVAPAPAAKPTPKPVTDLGSCTLKATGAVTAEQTTPGGRTATNISYWYTEEERRKMMGVDGFVVNCIGPDIRFSLVPGGGKIDGMPFKPKKYDFVKGKGDANIMTTFGKATFTAPSGTIDITAFNTTHIAGTVNLTGKLQPGGGEVKLTGSFDLACAGFKNCGTE